MNKKYCEICEPICTNLYMNFQLYRTLTNILYTPLRYAKIQYNRNNEKSSKISIYKQTPRNCIETEFIKLVV